MNASAPSSFARGLRGARYSWPFRTRFLFPNTRNHCPISRSCEPGRISTPNSHPGPEDILVLFEVADASVMYDRNTKLPLYARAGVGEVWVVDLVRNAVDVYSSPHASGYETHQRCQRGATASSIALPELNIPVDEILVG